MTERHLAKDAVNIAFVAMIAYWICCTKSGRICFILLILLGLYHSYCDPDLITDGDPKSAFSQCMKEWHSMSGLTIDQSIEKQHKINTCYINNN